MMGFQHVSPINHANKSHCCSLDDDSWISYGYGTYSWISYGYNIAMEHGLFLVDLPGVLPFGCQEGTAATALEQHRNYSAIRDWNSKEGRNWELCPTKGSYLDLPCKTREMMGS